MRRRERGREGGRDTHRGGGGGGEGLSEKEREGTKREEERVAIQGGGWHWPARSLSNLLSGKKQRSTMQCADVGHVLASCC